MASCPICTKAVMPPHAPFCSKRCQQLDLAKWIDGNYSVPVFEEDDMLELSEEL